MFINGIARLLPFVVLCDLKPLQVSALFGGPLILGAWGKLPPVGGAEHKFADESTMDDSWKKLHTVRREPPWPFTGKSGRQGDSGNRDRVGPKQRTQFYW